jgi:hypothetical protein
LDHGYASDTVALRFMCDQGHFLEWHTYGLSGINLKHQFV